MRAYYSNAGRTQISVRLEPGDMLGSVLNPAASEKPLILAIGMEAGNREFDELHERIVAGLLTVEDYAVPLAPPVAMPDISDRQFGRGLWDEGIITFDECADFVSVGAIPAKLQVILDTLPDDLTGNPTPRKEAILFIKGAKLYEFAHPLVDVIRQAQGWTEDHLRERWLAWSTL